MDTNEIMEKIFISKNYSRVRFRLWNENEQMSSWKLAKTTLMMPLFPCGRCIRVDDPIVREYESIREVFIETRKPQNNEDSRFKVLLIHPNTASLVLPSHQEMAGDEMVIDPNKAQITQYSVQAKIHIYKEDNPNYKCTSYEKGTSFESCISKDIKRTSESLINCFPPWLETENEKNICKGHLNTSKTTFYKLQGLWDQKLLDKETACLSPCENIIYKSKREYYTSSTSNVSASMTYILFDKTAVIYRARFTVGVITLLSRIGGYIGGGRTLLWIIIAGCGFTKTLDTLFKTWKIRIQDCEITEIIP